MRTTERQNEIIEVLKNSKKPLSGTVLAKIFNVSRQVIVTDIAVLRAGNKNIISTNKGYMLHIEKDTCKRTFYVKHNDLDIAQELNIVVDNGGNILDVIVDHDIYGTITCELVIKNRSDVIEFCKNLSESKNSSLMSLTNSFHYHTVEASSEEVLDLIESKLKENKFLA